MAERRRKARKAGARAATTRNEKAKRTPKKVMKPKAMTAARTRRVAPRTTVANRKNGAKTATATTLMRIRALDPQATCGSGTTVLQLFRVDDLPFGSGTTHLVFFDRHGWYCEHGRDCPAVAAVRKHEKLGTLTR